MMATSRAVERWPASSSPQAFLKVVFTMPSSAAFWFISSAKAGSDPPMNSATATAASLALDTQMAFIISSRVKVSPGSSQI